MRIKDRLLTVLILGLIVGLLVACGGAEETPVPAPTEAPPAAEAPTATEPPAEAEATPTEEAVVEAPTATEAPAEAEAPAATEEPAEAEAPPPTEEAAEAEAPPPTEEAAAPAEDAQTAVFNSVGNLRSVKTYRSKVTIEKDGETMETLYEYDLPDKFRLVSEYAEMVGIGEDVYTKVGDTWTKMPGAGMGGENMGTTIANVEFPKESIQEARFEGTEEIDGVPYHKYVYTTNFENAPAMEITTWLGIEDGLPYKIVTEPEPGTIVTQILYDFNADITIEAPIE